MTPEEKRELQLGLYNAIQETGGEVRARPNVRSRQTDSDALNQIQEILRDPDWGVGMLEDIAEIVGETGRVCEDYPDHRPTWGRH